MKTLPLAALGFIFFFLAGCGTTNTPCCTATTYYRTTYYSTDPYRVYYVGPTYYYPSGAVYYYDYDY